METLTVRTGGHAQFLDITDQVEEVVKGSGVSTGVARVYVPHTTAGVTINENADPDVVHDILEDLDRLIPESEGYYRHGEGKSSSHMKASLMGSCQTVLVENGRLVLGTWQGIYFCEFDGPRTRRVHVQVTAG